MQTFIRAQALNLLSKAFAKSRKKKRDKQLEHYEMMDRVQQILSDHVEKDTAKQAPVTASLSDAASELATTKEAPESIKSEKKAGRLALASVLFGAATAASSALVWRLQSKDKLPVNTTPATLDNQN